MVAKFCSRSHGEPEPGVRSAAMISRRREISRDGVIEGPIVNVGAGTLAEPVDGRDRAAPICDSHKGYYGMFSITAIFGGFVACQRPAQRLLAANSILRPSWAGSHWGGRR